MTMYVFKYARSVADLLRTKANSGSEMYLPEALQDGPPLLYRTVFQGNWLMNEELNHVLFPNKESLSEQPEHFRHPCLK